jgi:hypothetical protein
LPEVEVERGTAMNTTPVNASDLRCRLGLCSERKPNEHHSTLCRTRRSYRVALIAALDSLIRADEALEDLVRLAPEADRSGAQWVSSTLERAITELEGTLKAVGP